MVASKVSKSTVVSQRNFSELLGCSVVAGSPCILRTISIIRHQQKFLQLVVFRGPPLPKHHVPARQSKPRQTRIILVGGMRESERKRMMLRRRPTIRRVAVCGGKSLLLTTIIIIIIIIIAIINNNGHVGWEFNVELLPTLARYDRGPSTVHQEAKTNVWMVGPRGRKADYHLQKSGISLVMIEL